jgi:23S rRNA (uracil1939-C5)-methyltransferase
MAAPGELVEVTLSALAYGGEAFGRLPDGRAVFVPYALPGEVVRLRLTEQKRGHARAELVEVLQASPERIAPRCRHYGACGGCHYQHLSYPAQLAAKTAILKEQLERLGGIANPPVRPCVAAPQPFGYRNNLQFHLDEQGRLAFQAARAERLVPIEECHLPEPGLDEAWRQLSFEPGSGVERVGLRQGAGGDLLMLLEGDDPLAPEFSVEELPLSAVYLGENTRTLLAGSPALWMELGGRRLRVSAEAFFQVNLPVAELLLRALLERLPPGDDLAMVDAYCGVGFFSAFLAGRARRLVGIEDSPAACADFVENLDEFDVELYEDAVENVLPALDFRPDVVVLDPPRAGVHPQALEALLHLAAPRLLYISCDPSTLGRDARRLAAGGYRLVEAIPFDMFPQTYHVEALTVWERE